MPMRQTRTPPLTKNKTVENALANEEKMKRMDFVDADFVSVVFVHHYRD